MPLYEISFQRPDARATALSAQQLRKLGPVIQVAVLPTPEHMAVLKGANQPQPTAVTGFALIDTGAATTCVDESVCTKLGISPTGVIQMAHAGGNEARPCFPVQILFPSTKLPALINPRVASVVLAPTKQPFILLLGRDILARMRLVYNGPMGRVEIAW